MNNVQVDHHRKRFCTGRVYSYMGKGWVNLKKYE